MCIPVNMTLVICVSPHTYHYPVGIHKTLKLEVSIRAFKDKELGSIRKKTAVSQWFDLKSVSVKTVQHNSNLPWSPAGTRTGANLFKYYTLIGRLWFSSALSVDKIILRWNMYLFGREGVGDTHITGSHIKGDAHISLVICVRGYTYHWHPY